MSEQIHYAEHGTVSSAPFCARRNFAGNESSVEAIFTGSTWLGTDNPEGVTCYNCIEFLAAEVERALTETPEQLQQRLSKLVSDRLKEGLLNRKLPSHQEIATMITDATRGVPGCNFSEMEVVTDPAAPDVVTIRMKVKTPRPVVVMTFEVAPG